MVGAGIGGFGSGALEVGMSGLFLDRFHASRGRALSRLHLFFSLGGLAAPLAIGALVEAGVAWRVPFCSHGRRRAGNRPAACHARSGRTALAAVAPRRTRPAGRRVPLPLVLLALAIAFYVASESGVSSWLVRFLDAAPIGLATFALSLFWAGLAIGRLVASRVADRFTPTRSRRPAGWQPAWPIVAAVAVPWIEVSIALFAVAGVACGPIYPMIVASAGALYPTRANAVSGVLTASSVVGSVVYPPAWASSRIGLGSASGWPGRACSRSPAPARSSWRASWPGRPAHPSRACPIRHQARAGAPARVTRAERRPRIDGATEANLHANVKVVA